MNVSPPPRALSLADRVGLFFDSTNMIALGLLAGGLFVAAIVFLATSSSRQLSYDDPRVEGKVVAVFHSGRPDERGRTPDEYTYVYEVDGHPYRGKSVSHKGIEGDTVRVQYVPGSPEVSRIEGMATPGEGTWLLLAFTLVLGGVGLLMLYGGFFNWRREIVRMTHGVVTDATWSRQYPSSGNQVLYHFTDVDGQAREVAVKRPVSDFVEGELISLCYVPGSADEPILFNDLPPKQRDFLLAAR